MWGSCFWFCAPPPSTRRLSLPARRPPPQLAQTQLAHTELVITQISPYILSSHNLLTHNLSITTCPHTSYHRKICSHTTCPHITYSHTTCSHRTCPHTTCPYGRRGPRLTFIFTSRTGRALVANTTHATNASTRNEGGCRRKCHACHAKWRWTSVGAPARQTKLVVAACHACHARCLGAHGNSYDQSPPSAASATSRKVKMNVSDCHAPHAKRGWKSQVPRLPRKVKVDVTQSRLPHKTKVEVAKCQACDARRRCAHGNQLRHQSPPNAVNVTSATQSEDGCQWVPRLPWKIDAKCQARRRGHENHLRMLSSFLVNWQLRSLWCLLFQFAVLHVGYIGPCWALFSCLIARFSDTLSARNWLHHADAVIPEHHVLWKKRRGEEHFYARIFSSFWEPKGSLLFLL